jgi:hypothetical protein
MELFTYYSLDEVIDRTDVISTLKMLKKEGKIDYQLDGDIVKITDLDLEQDEIDDLLDIFDCNDVFPYYDMDDSDDEDDEYYDEDDEY